MNGSPSSHNMPVEEPIKYRFPLHRQGDGDIMTKGVLIMGSAEQQNGKPVTKRWWFWGLIVLFLIMFVGGVNSCASHGTGSTKATGTASTAQTTSDGSSTVSTGAGSSATSSDTSSSAPTATTGTGTPSTTASPATSVPAEYKSALAKAQRYSDIMYMSKQKLYDQLTSEYGEKFSAEAAQYAIDNVRADWNANALKKAKQYEKEMSMSPSAIYDQLTSEYGEQFTAAEAQYAVDKL